MVAEHEDPNCIFDNVLGGGGSTNLQVLHVRYGIDYSYEMFHDIGSRRRKVKVFKLPFDTEHIWARDGEGRWVGGSAVDMRDKIPVYGGHRVWGTDSDPFLDDVRMPVHD